MSKKVIIFGTGGVAKSVKDYYEYNGYVIVAFSDNNEKTWNTYVEDIAVIPPSKIKSYSWDIIALGMFKHTDIVTKQLVDMGINPNYIKIPIKQRKIYPYPYYEYSKEELTSLRSDDYNSKSNKEYNSWNIDIKDKYFWEQIELLKISMEENNIPISKVCVVKGMCMVAHGCRPCKKNEDMDIIMTSDLRKIYGTGKIFVAGSIEVCPQHYMLGRSDDELINNPERHVVVGGVKFMRLEEMYTYKREGRLIKAHKPGLREDLRLLDNFFKTYNVSYDYSKTEFADFMDLD